jgi:hypothetical protein
MHTHTQASRSILGDQQSCPSYLSVRPLHEQFEQLQCDTPSVTVAATVPEL